MRLVKVGLASINTKVGAFTANVDRALKCAREMSEDGVTVGVFPEQVIGGYPSEDLIQWQGFVDHQWPELLRFAKETEAFATAFAVGVAVQHHGLRYNCAALVAAGQVFGVVPKEKLPTYGIFYEGRTYARGSPGLRGSVHGVPFGDYIFELDFGRVALEVCEDVWSADGPMKRRAYSGAELVLNLSASPFRLGVTGTRKEMLATRASDHQCTIAYTNQVGSNDGLIFDGGGFLVQNGKILLDAPRFEEGWAAATVDLDRTARMRAENSTWRNDSAEYFHHAEAVPMIRVGPSLLSTKAKRETLRYPAPAHGSFFLPSPEKPVPAREQFCEDVLDALALGVGDYFEKLSAFKKIGIALSGGRDSMLTLLIAYRYAKRARPAAPGELIQAFYMPSRYSSAETQNAAETLCRELSIPFQVVSIDEAFEREKAVTVSMLKPGEPLTALTEQNIQARLRAQRMWNWSNSSGGLFLQTGNMSEKSVGYTTIGGDLMGALAVIANVPKTVVLYLLDYLEEKTGLAGIKLVKAKPAGPELASNQTGEGELMPFPVLDACLALFVGEKLLPEEVKRVLGEMFPDRPAAELSAQVDKFVKLFLQSIYKWVQSPLSLHIGNLDLERERTLQLPVVTGSSWLKGT